MVLEIKPVLHVLDSDKCFSAAYYLKEETTDAFWNLSMKIWVIPYVGYPDELRCDQGPQLRSKRWCDILQLSGINLNFSEVESHNALGVGERYRAFLLKIFTNLRYPPKLRVRFCFELCCKINELYSRCSWSCSYITCFSSPTNISPLPSSTPGQTARMKAMEDARQEMTELAANTKLQRALRTQVPHAADKVFKIGDEILVYKEKPVKEWLGPGRVLEVDGKSVQVKLEGRVVLLSIDKIKKKGIYEIKEKEKATEKEVKIKDGGEGELKKTKDRTKKVPEQTITDSETHNGSGKVPETNLDFLEIATACLDSLWSSLRQLREPSGICIVKEGSDENATCNSVAREWKIQLTETLYSGDPRCDSQIFKGAKEKEVQVLERRGTWRISKCNSLLINANFLGGKLFLTLKSANTLHEEAKARYVAQ